MIGLALFALLSGAPAQWPPPPDTPIYEAQFAPLRKSQRSYAKDGPVGPYYPARAYYAHWNGDAVLLCRAAENGVLKRCRELAEKPKDQGFGPAARIMAEHRRITVPGAPVGETIYVHVPFVLGAPAEVEP